MIRRNLELVLIALVGAGMMAAGCGSTSTYHMSPGERAIGADGVVEVSQDDHGNQVIEMEVAHLPLPHQFDEQKSTFSIWLEPAEYDGAYNLGQLQLGDERSGEIQFTTPFQEFDLRVTAEASETETRPGTETVLHQSIGK